MSDTSTEAVERFTYSLHSLAQYEYLPDVDKEVYGEAISLILALVAERDTLRAEKEAAVAAEREACARLVGSMFAPGSEEEVTCDVAAAAIRARGSTDALAERDARIRAEALREARRVKPLEWKGRGAFCDFGVWQIVTDDDGDFGYRFSGSPTVTFWHWKTEAEAKAAAQADYERRILSALIPEDT